jgi:hypothetical protein
VAGDVHTGGQHFPSRPSPNFRFLFPSHSFFSILSDPQFDQLSPFSLLPKELLVHHIKMAATSSLDHLSNRMKLEWHSKLNTEMVPAKNFRRTSIIGTIGMSLFLNLPCNFSLRRKKKSRIRIPR